MKTGHTGHTDCAEAHADHTGHKYTRREFLKGTGGVLGIITAAAHLLPDIAVAADGASSPPARNPVQLKRLLNEMDERGAAVWSVPRKDGEFLHLMIKATRAKNVLELGTSQGFSAIWMGLALEETGGRLTTIEIDAERHNEARRNIDRAGLSQRITLIKGDAHRGITKLEGPFDFVFMDADKEGQVDYFKKLYPKKLPPGAMIAVHNAIRQAYAMNDYLGVVRKHPDFDTVTVSATMDDGFCLSYRHRGP
jgi:predicted O-methyltransferase YrrM